MVLARVTNENLMAGLLLRYRKFNNVDLDVYRNVLLEKFGYRLSPFAVDIRGIMDYIMKIGNSYYMIDTPEMEGAFLPVDQWLGIEVDDEKLHMSNGTAYAVKLNGSKMLENHKINSDNLYIGVRNYSEELSDEMKEKIADAKRIANAIVEY